MHSLWTSFNCSLYLILNVKNIRIWYLLANYKSYKVRWNKMQLLSSIILIPVSACTKYLQTEQAKLAHACHIHSVHGLWRCRQMVNSYLWYGVECSLSCECLYSIVWETILDVQKLHGAYYLLHISLSTRNNVSYEMMDSEQSLYR